MINPYKLSAFNYADYNIKACVNSKGYNRYRAMKVLKNSYGIDDFRVSFMFLGENGLMNELPTAKEMQEHPEWYKSIANPPNKIKDYL